MRRRRHVESQTPRIRVSKLLDSDSEEEKKRKKKIAISRVRVRKVSDSDSEEEEEATIARVRVRKVLDSGSEVEKIAIPGIRVFPSMPSVGTRRSTRVFVPKSITKTAGDADLSPARVLRSGKRLVLESVAAEKLPDGDYGGGDGWVGWWKQEGLGGAIDGCDDVSEEGNLVGVDAGGQTAAVQEPAIVDDAGGGRVDRMFGVVYSRKGRRSAGESTSAEEAGEFKDRMYGIPFVRKQRRRKQSIVRNSNEFSIGFDPRRHKKALFFVFVESSWSTLRRFSCFLVSVLGWMRRSRFRLSEFTAFLLSHSVASVFGLHGIHFESLPIGSSETHHLPCRAARGICVIYGARQFVPLISLNFAALPFYFMDLHWRMHLRSYYLPDAFARFLMGLFENSGEAIISYGEHDSCIPMEMGISRMEIVGSGIPPLKRNVVDCVSEATEFAVQNVVNRRGSRFRKHQQRRSSLRTVRAPKNPSTPLQNEPNAMRFNSVLKVSPVQDATLVTAHEKSLETYANDFGVRDDYMAFSSPRSSLRQKRSVRNSQTENIKELKSVLVDLKQNIGSARCSANILVIESDRCWRDDGAEVMLECSGSNEWRLAVKSQRSTRYLHKAQEMRNSTCNRYTHAMMWSSGNGWKLEFSDRKDWFIFKELHRECCERNAQAASVTVKTIPIPGVQEVLGYGDGINVPFLRPDVYISVRENEVERALMSQNANYDMDYEDEVWLEQLNCNFHDNESGDDGHISYDIFERIIFVFEKAAYSHPDDVSDADRATNLGVDLGRRDMLASVFEYWLRKRKQKQSALVRVFQGSPPKRAQLIPRHILRKKRSFKRQASRVGRGKPDFLFQAMAEKEALQRVQEAEQAANSAVESAVLKRQKAQVLMQNADLATYKAVLSLRLAEAVRVAESTDANSLILS